MTKVKPFVLKFKLKQKLILNTINLVLILVLVTWFFPLKQIQAAWLGMSRENTIDNLSNNSGDSQEVQIQLDSQGNPYIVWSDDSAGNGDIFFKKWTVGAGPGICGAGIDDCWTKMDGTLGYDNLSDNSGLSKEPQIGQDSANLPYVIWSDDTTLFNFDIYFSKWTLGAGAGVCGGPSDCWTNMAGTVSGYENIADTGGDSDYVVMQLDSANIPYIVWRDATTGITDIYFTKWTPGTGWTQMDGTTPGYDNLSDNVGGSHYPEIQFDLNNTPYVVWQDSTTGNGDVYLTHWDGAKWAKMDGTAGYDNLSNNVGWSEHWPNVQSLILDSNNNPNVVWHDYTTGAGDVYFSKWTPGAGAGVCGGPADCWTNMAGTASGYDNVSNNSDVGGVAQIQLDTSNNPYIVWHDGTTGDFDIYFTKWTPGAGAGVCGGPSNCWTNMAGTVSGYENISNNSSSSVLPNILLDSANRPYIIWHDYVAGTLDIYFTKWTPGAEWTHMDGVTSGYENISNTSGGSAYFQIDLDNINFPFIVWYDDTEGNNEIYFTRWLLEGQGQVNISASVDPSLTLNLSATTCDLGTFDAIKVNTCQYNTTVTTNASSGYTAYIRDDGKLRNATNDINDVAGGTTDPGSEEYGVATSDTDSVGITAVVSGADCTTANGGTDPVDASVLTTSDQSYATEDAPIDSDVVTLCHSASIISTTPAGAYAQTATITVVGNF